ncbi:MAG: carbamoyltransferase C-terminal domain-containing protein [Candidatus Omnitrophota bacterium]
MNILGIIAFGMNPAACILQDGKCISFAEEERFTRLKVSEGLFPAKAVAYCLNYAHLNLDSINRIAFGWDVKKYPWAMARNFSSTYIRYALEERRSYHARKEQSTLFSVLEGLTDYHPLKVRTKISEGLRLAGLKGGIPQIEFVPHHLAHAYSSYFCSKFDKAGILTIDGHGEDLCTQLAIGDKAEVRVVETYPIPNSLGWFYAAITEYLGFLPYRDEGKLMGLAALGEKERGSNKWIEPLGKALKIKCDKYEVDPTYTLFGGHFYGKRFTDRLVELFTHIDPLALPVSYGEKTQIDGMAQSKYLLDTYVNIAWAAQELLERAAVMLAKKLVVKFGMENLCISGGVGLNCKMNGEILRQSGCKSIFVQPASNDAGAALGAAMFVAKEHGENIRNPLENAYLGPGFTNDQIRAMLKNCKVNFRELSDPVKEAVSLLEAGRIIAWFQGRMEFGSRALGNRSILANPVFPGVKNKVNEEVKYRESWRPFCPSLADENKEDYINNPKESAFMTVAYQAKESIKEKLSSVVHADGSIRPQTVTSESNFLFHSLISNLGKSTGYPIVLNTSFNVRGEPIVCSPQEAVRCFYSNGLDALVLGNFILTKS